MRNIWRNKAVSLLIFSSLLTTISQAEARCLNLAYLRWRVVQRLDAAKYEVITREGTNFCGNASGSVCYPIEAVRAVLITMDDRFQSDGVIRTPVWVEDTDKNPEMTEMPLENGFKKKIRVVRETAACTTYGEQQEKEANEKYVKDQEVQRKIAAQNQEKEKKRLKEQKNKEKREKVEQEKTEALWK